MNRRAALRLAAGAAAWTQRPRASFAGTAAPFAMAEVGPGIFVRRGVDEDATAENDGAIANIGFIIGDEAVAVIDPGGSRTDGERLLATIRATTGRPIRHVILSHVHPDHIFGCGAFRDLGATFVGHARLRGVLVERGEYYRNQLADILGFDEAGTYEMPKRFVETSATIDLGNRVLDLRAHKTAHTDNDLSVFDRRTATLWAADLLFVQRIPSLDGSLTGWLGVLEGLRALPATQAVPGHGPASVPWPSGTDDEMRYLSTLAREIRAIIAKGGDIETAVETVGQSERSRWTLFDDYNGHNVTAAFKELEWE